MMSSVLMLYLISANDTEAIAKPIDVDAMSVGVVYFQRRPGNQYRLNESTSLKILDATCVGDC